MLFSGGHSKNLKKVGGANDRLLRRTGSWGQRTCRLPTGKAADRGRGVAVSPRGCSVDKSTGRQERSRTRILPISSFFPRTGS